VVYAAAAVCTIVWLYRVRSHATQMSQVPHRRRKVWVTLGWFVPIVSFWFPYQVVADIYRASEPAENPRRYGFLVSAPGYIGWWWACWLIGMIADRVVVAVTNGNVVGRNDLIAGSGLGSISAVTWVAAAVLFIRYVRDVTAMQHERAALIGARFPGSITIGRTAARSSRSRRWVAAVTAAVIIVPLVAVIGVKPALDAYRRTTAADNDQIGAGSTLGVPPTAIGWNLVDDRAARRRAERATTRVERSLGGDVSAVYGEYRSRGRLVVYMGFNTTPGSQLHTELQQSPARSVEAFLSANKYGESQPVGFDDNGVAMACAERGRSSTQNCITCVWADSRSLASASWFVPRLNMDRASRLSQRLYSDVSQSTA
jgi:Domain of unknown function (DUF4328)